jgi:glycosyltransferase involved in cell wall biosynthesis
MFTGYIKNIQHDKFVFDMIDYWVTHEAYHSYKKRLKANYQKISENASNIFTVAPTQVKLLKQGYGRNGHAEFIPNGIDVQLFKQGRQSVDELDEIKAHWDHIVGYIGTINTDRVDLSMIEQAAKAMKKTHFYIAGPVWKGSMTEVERLEHTYQNIHFPGRISRKDWASVAAYFDVAINPHKHTDFIQYTSPTKIFEYIAAGKPVVSTGVQGVRDLEEWVSIADDHAGFIKALQDEVSSLNLSDAHLRQAYAYKNFSWKDKVGHMLSKII